MVDSLKICALRGRLRQAFDRAILSRPLFYLGNHCVAGVALFLFILGYRLKAGLMAETLFAEIRL
jgi:hypothetical protein